MDNLLYRSFKRTRTEDEFDLPLKKPKIAPLPPTYPYPSAATQQQQQQQQQHQSHNVSSGSLDSSSSQPHRHWGPKLLKPFTISTRTNLEYDQINQFLHDIHVVRYGDPEIPKSEWQDGDHDMEDVQMEERLTYNTINATLREAFLERHRQQQQQLPN